MRNASHRFWPCIAAAVAVAVIAVPAASAGADKYDTEVWIANEGRGIGDPPRPGDIASWGAVKSEVRKCRRGRRVVVYKKRPGEDLKVGHDRSSRRGGDFEVNTPRHGPIYAQVKRKVLEDGDVCRAGRSPNEW